MSSARIYADTRTHAGGPTTHPAETLKQVPVGRGCVPGRRCAQVPCTTSTLTLISNLRTRNGWEKAGSRMARVRLPSANTSVAQASTNGIKAARFYVRVSTLVRAPWRGSSEGATLRTKKAKGPHTYVHAYIHTCARQSVMGGHRARLRAPFEAEGFGNAKRDAKRGCLCRYRQGLHRSEIDRPDGIRAMDLARAIREQIPIGQARTWTRTPAGRTGSFLPERMEGRAGQSGRTLKERVSSS